MAKTDDMAAQIAELQGEINQLRTELRLVGLAVGELASMRVGVGKIADLLERAPALAEYARRHRERVDRARKRQTDSVTPTRDRYLPVTNATMDNAA